MAERVVVVTGASAGVGRATAIAFGAQGASVALLARGEVGLEAAAKEVEAAGGRALTISVDVADHAALDAAADRVETELGPIDEWDNSAFSSVFAPFRETSIEEFHRTTEVTYLGFVHGTKAAVDRMAPRNRGTIVQVGSALAYRGIPLQSAYCGAKHAIVGFTESLRCELMHDGLDIAITQVHLPAVNTPQFDWVLSKLPRHPQPVPPIYQPEVAAEAIVYAADHPQRREYIVGSSAVATVFGAKVAGGLLDRYLARTGYDAQQTDQPVDDDRPANLFEPADGAGGRDFGTHGSFDGQAKPKSWQVRLTRTPWPVAAAVNLGAAAIAGTRMIVKDRKAFADILRSAL
jgi:NAD(P)-dependent dehydrogenase (short-subunit alcohol dehydrogenase family)